MGAGSVLVLLCAVMGSVMGARDGDLITKLPGWEAPMPFKAYSGHLAVNNKYMVHYMFMESQASPSSDPVSVWQQGGPGGSSTSVGLFTEMGYWQLNDDSLKNKTADGTPRVLPNPHAWNRISNMLYFEHPPGVGYSYCLGNDGQPLKECPTWDDTTQAEVFYDTLVEFFKGFSEYSKNDFYLTGESYAGQYLPNIAHEISQHSDAPFTLKGFMVGNGCIGQDHICSGPNDERHHVELLYGHGMCSKKLYEAIIDACFTGARKPECPVVLSELSREAGAYNIYNVYDNCGGDNSVVKTFSEHMATDYWAPKLGGGNPYPCGGMTVTDQWMQMKAVESALHINGTRGLSRFSYKAMTSPSIALYPELIKKYRVLIYNGDADACVPYNGNEEWTSGLGLPVQEKWRPWKLDNVVAGYVTSYTVPDGPYKFHFLTIKLAGHMVPTFQPERAFAFYERYLKNSPF